MSSETLYRAKENHDQTFHLIEDQEGHPFVRVRQVAGPYSGENLRISRATFEELLEEVPGD